MVFNEAHSILLVLVALGINFGQTVNSTFTREVFWSTYCYVLQMNVLLLWKVLLGDMKDTLTCQNTVPTVIFAGNKLSKDMGIILSKNNSKIIN
jgi:hypothetical protein